MGAKFCKILHVSHEQPIKSIKKACAVAYPESLVPRQLYQADDVKFPSNLCYQRKPTGLEISGILLTLPTEPKKLRN